MGAIIVNETRKIKPTTQLERVGHAVRIDGVLIMAGPQKPAMTNKNWHRFAEVSWAAKTAAKKGYIGIYDEEEYAFADDETMTKPEPKPISPEEQELEAIGDDASLDRPKNKEEIEAENEIPEPIAVKPDIIKKKAIKGKRKKKKVEAKAEEKPAIVEPRAISSAEQMSDIKGDNPAEDKPGAGEAKEARLTKGTAKEKELDTAGQQLAKDMGLGATDNWDDA